jgi:hypothetical protein
MKYLLLFASFSLVGCGMWGVQRVVTNDSEQRIVQDGESVTYVTIRLEFIEQFKQLCTERHQSIVSQPLREKVIAQCTVELLTSLNIDPFSSLPTDIGAYCEQPDSELSAEEIVIKSAVCQ